MTGDLAASQAKLEETYRDLQAKHTRDGGSPPLYRDRAGGGRDRRGLARRRRARHHDQRRRRAPARPARGEHPGPAGDAVFRPPEYAEIATLIQRMGRAARGHAWTARCTCGATARRWRCSPPPPRCAGPHGGYMGMVLAFDDLTELLKAQRLAAWREVAQRIAHEIKNPLTPIQLSAQRLRRRLSADRSPDEKRLLEEATGHHHPGGGRAAAARRRVLALRPHARAHPQADRPRAAARGRGRPLPRVAPGARPSARFLARPAVARGRSRPASSARCSTWSTTRSRRWAAPAR